MNKVINKFKDIEKENLLYAKMQNLLRNLDLHKVILKILEIDVIKRSHFLIFQLTTKMEETQGTSFNGLKEEYEDLLKTFFDFNIHFCKDNKKN